MAKFCKYCGDPITEGEAFCDNCGRPIEAPPPPPSKPTCSRCGAELTPSAKFCRSCGAPVAATVAAPAVAPRPAPAAAPAPAPVRRATPPPLPKVAPTPPPMPGGQPVAPQSAAAFPLTQSLGAAAAPGEVDCGVIQLPGLAPVQQAAEKVLSPLGGIFSTVGSFLGGVFGIFRSPGAFIGTALMAALWFGISQLRGAGMDEEVVDTLSRLTFAQGGYGRTGAGAVGGLFGMGTVAAMFGSLLSGGMIDAFKGIDHPPGEQGG